jgi:hypothetical protein
MQMQTEGGLLFRGLYCISKLLFKMYSRTVRRLAVALFFLLRLLSRCVRYDRKRNKFPSVQLVSVICLIWHRVSTSEGHLQGSNTKCMKVIVYDCMKF